MTDFRILNNVTRGVLRFADTAIETHVADDVASATITRTKGLINPFHLLGMGELRTGLFRPTIWSKTTTTEVVGNGASAFDEAIKGLHNLGQRHGIEGISLAENPNQYGGLMRRGDIGYEYGGRILRDIGKGDVESGRAVAFRLDKQARYANDFVG